MDPTRRAFFGALLGTGAVVTAAAVVPDVTPDRPWMSANVHCPQCAALLQRPALSFNSTMTTADWARAWRQQMTTPQHVRHGCGWSGDVTFGVVL